MFSTLNVFINLVLNTHINQVQCIYHFTERPNNLLQIDSTVYPLVIYQASIIDNVHFEHYCNIIVITEHNPVRILEKLEHKFKYDCCMKYNGARKYLIFTRSEAETEEIFASSSLRFFADLLVVRIDEDESCRNIFLCTKDVILKMFTHKFVGNENNNDPVLLDIWYSRNATFLFGNNLFPDKLNNQQGRNLTISSFTFVPYTNFEDHEGSELTLIYEYAKRHNNTINFKEKSPWGKVFANFTGIGLMGVLAADEADIIFNGFFLWAFSNKFFDVSHGFMHTEVSCIARPPTIFIHWNFVLPHFTSIFIIIIILISALIVFLFTLNTAFSMDFHSLDIQDTLSIVTDHIFLVTKIQLQQSLNDIKHMSYRIRFNVISLFLMSIILASKYSSGLSSVIAVPHYHRAIDYPIDIAKYNLKWQARVKESWIEFIKNDETELYVRIRENAEELDVNNELRFQVGYVVEKLTSGLYSVDLDIDMEILKMFKVMKTYIYAGTLVFYVRKNSIYLPSFNKFLLRAQQAGLGIKWEANCLLHSMGLRRQYALMDESYKITENLKLRISHIRGVVWIWFAGCSVAFLCFLVECYIKRDSPFNINIRKK